MPPACDRFSIATLARVRADQQGRSTRRIPWPRRSTTAVADEAISRFTAQLTLFTEYREALISAAVTGELDVDTFDSDRNLEAAIR
jgi:hypothetical protein